MRRIREDVGDDIALVRAMPTLTVDGYSQVALYAEEGSLTAEQVGRVEGFFGNFGNCIWLDSEDKFPAYTLFAASMIAFLANYLLEFKKHAVELGFSDGQSEMMLAGALRSAAHLIERGYTLEQIQEKVATKGGMTAMGIAASERGNAQSEVARTMLEDGIEHSKALAKS